MAHGDKRWVRVVIWLVVGGMVLTFVAALLPAVT